MYGVRWQCIGIGIHHCVHIRATNSTPILRVSPQYLPVRMRASMAPSADSEGRLGPIAWVRGSAGDEEIERTKPTLALHNDS
jgi:hypothetical protein